MSARKNTDSEQEINDYIELRASDVEYGGEEQHSSDIITEGQTKFNLAGEALDDFVRRRILALLRRGARPIESSYSLSYDWDMVYGYGETPKEIVEAVIAEWKASGRDPPPWGDATFMAPNEFVKQ